MGHKRTTFTPYLAHYSSGIEHSALSSVLHIKHWDLTAYTLQSVLFFQLEISLIVIHRG